MTYSPDRCVRRSGPANNRRDPRRAGHPHQAATGLLRELLGHCGPDGRWGVTNADREVCVSIRRGHGAAGAVFFESSCGAEGRPRQWFVSMDGPVWPVLLRQEVERLLGTRGGRRF